MKKIKKRLWLAAACIMLVLSCALIPFNLFVMNFPEWVTVLCSATACLLIAGWLFVFRTRLLTKILLPIVFAAVSLVCSFAPYLIPYWNSYSLKSYRGAVSNYDEVIAYKDAEADMKALRHHLEKVHPMFADGFDGAVADAYAQALTRLKEMETITVNDLRREIQIVLHLMHDAHTTTYNSYPDDRYLADFLKKRSEGYSLVSVNGKRIGEIIDGAEPYYCYESKDWISVDVGSLASLDFYGYLSPFAYVWSDGEREVTEIYTEQDFVPYDKFLEIRSQYFESTAERGFVSYEIDEQKSLAVLTLTSCIYNEAYRTCVREMFTEVKEKGIRTVAVDVRGNGGGNSLVANELIRYLPITSYRDVPYDMRLGFLTIHDDGYRTNKPVEGLTFHGNVFVLTDTDSFSSAMDFAMLIQDNHLGKVIGEPPANAVNGYGDVAGFHLPNTGLFVQVSLKKWYRVDAENPDAFVIPDYPCDGGDVYETLYALCVGEG